MPISQIGHVGDKAQFLGVGDHERMGVRNSGPGTIYYGNNEFVTSTTADGAVGVGTTQIITAGRWIISDGFSAFSYYPVDVAESAGSSTPAGGRFRGDYTPGQTYYTKDIVVANGFQYYATRDVANAPTVFEVGTSPIIWVAIGAVPPAAGQNPDDDPEVVSPLVIKETEYDNLTPNPRVRYLISEDGGSTINAIYEGSILTWSFKPDAATRPPVAILNPYLTYVGELVLGTVVTANPGLWRRWPNTLTYQWKRNGVNIGAATNRTYTIAALDENTTLTCEVTATNISASAAPIVTVGAIIATFPIFDDYVEASDTAIASHTSDSAHTWSNVVSTGITVIGNGGRIRGSTSTSTTTTAVSSWTPPGNSYMVRGLCQAMSALNGMGIGLRVDANGNGYFGHWLRSTSQYQITKRTGGGAGGAGVSVTTLATVSVTGDGSSPRYLRLECSESAANNATLTLKVGLSAAVLSTVTTATVDPTADVLTGAGKIGIISNPGATYSNTTRVQILELLGSSIPVTPPVPVNTAAPTITGSTTVGSVLTYHAGSWTNSPTLTWEWLRNSVPMDPQQTGATYTLAAADVGQSITIAEKAVNATAPLGVTAYSLPFTGIGGGGSTTFSGRLFSPTGPWNRLSDLGGADIILPNSADLVLNLKRQVFQLDPTSGVKSSGIGAPWIASSSFAVTEYIVNGSTMPKQQVSLVNYTGVTTDPAGLHTAMQSVPIPAGAYPAPPLPNDASQPNWTGGWDGHAYIYDVDADTLYEFWKFRNWYPDGVSPVTVSVTNNTGTSQKFPAGITVTMDGAAGGTILYTTRTSRDIIPAGATGFTVVVPNVITPAGATAIAGVPGLAMPTPPNGWAFNGVNKVSPRYWFLDFPGDATHPVGAQGQYSLQWGGVQTNASTASGFYSGSKRFWGAPACSASIAGGLITKRDLDNGVINHALACGLRYCSNRIRRPAQRTDGGYVMTPPAPAQSQRFIMDQSVNENDPKYAPWPFLKLFIKALKDYGMLIRDTSANVSFYMQDSSQTHIPFQSQWLGGAFPDYVLKQVPWDRLYAVARVDEPQFDFAGNIVPEGS